MLTTALLMIVLAQPEPGFPELSFRLTADAVFELPDPKLGGYRTLALSPDGKLVAGATFGVTVRVVVFDTTTKKEVVTFQHGSYGCVNALAFSPKGDLLASAGTDRVIKLTDTNTWKLKNAIKYDGGFYRLAFSPDGTVLLSGGTANNGDVILWDVAKGIRQQRIHVTDDAAVCAVAFSPSGKEFAATWGQKCKLWDHETCREIRELPRRLGGLAFSPDGTKMVSILGLDPKPGVWIVDKKNIRLWDVATGKETPLPMAAFQGPFTCVRWSPNGKRLALGRREGGVDLLNFEKPKEVVFINYRCTADTVCFSPDSKYLYVGGGAITRWKLDAAGEQLPPRFGLGLGRQK
jgi:WD40 repeat protein